MITSRHLRSVGPAVPTPVVEPLWRSLVGDRLRSRRRDRAENLTDTAARAGISPQYLSEVERGLKEPSSEVLAAVLGALDLTLVDLALQVAADLGPGLDRQAAPLHTGPVCLALAA